MKLYVDSETGALYMKLSEGRIHDTLEVDEGVYIDVDIAGRVLGVEFLSLDEFSETAARFGGTHNIPERIADPDEFMSNIPEIPETGAAAWGEPATGVAPAP